MLHACTILVSMELQVVPCTGGRPCAATKTTAAGWMLAIWALLATCAGSCVHGYAEGSMCAGMRIPLRLYVQLRRHWQSDALKPAARKRWLQGCCL
jgi:hypothetical protein